MFSITNVWFLVVNKRSSLKVHLPKRNSIVISCSNVLLQSSNSKPNMHLIFQLTEDIHTLFLFLPPHSQKSNFFPLQTNSENTPFTNQPTPQKKIKKKSNKSSVIIVILTRTQVMVSLANSTLRTSLTTMQQHKGGNPNHQKNIIFFIF